MIELDTLDVVAARKLESQALDETNLAALSRAGLERARRFVATMPCDALSAALRKRFDKTKHPRVPRAAASGCIVHGRELLLR